MPKLLELTGMETIHKFKTAARAWQFALRSTLPMVLFLGDIGDAAPYWVVAEAEAPRLETAGYDSYPWAEVESELTFTAGREVWALSHP